MSTRSRKKTMFAVLATTMSAIGLLTSPATAQAAPCTQWGFSGRHFLNQSNGWTMFFTSTGSRALGSAQAYGSGASMAGTIDGGLDGNSVNLVARWSNGPIGRYKGQVDANGYMNGITYDANQPNSTATWGSDQQLSCITR